MSDRSSVSAIPPPRSVPRVRGVPPKMRGGVRLLFSAGDLAGLLDQPEEWVVRCLERERVSFFPHAFMNAAEEWMVPVGDVREFLGGQREEQLYSMPRFAELVDADYEHLRKKVQAGTIACVRLKDLGVAPLIRIPASEYWRLRGGKPGRGSERGARRDAGSAGVPFSFFPGGAAGR